ncbi:MAG: hypothetical protein ACHQVS_04460 [Candidatus Babeliales bacterium]
MNKLFTTSILILLNIIIGNSLFAAHLSADGRLAVSRAKTEEYAQKELSREYTHEMHRQVIDTSSSLPPRSKPLQRILQGHAHLLDKAQVREPLPSEPIEDCREHAERLRTCTERNRDGGGEVCQAERANVKSCLKDPRSRESELPQYMDFQGARALEKRTDACDREHLGSARHVNHQWIPVLVGQAGMDRHDSCIVRAEYDIIEHSHSKEKEHEPRAEQDRKERASNPATVKPASFTPAAKKEEPLAHSSKDRAKTEVDTKRQASLNPTLESRREACDREHLGFAQHLNPQWLPVLVGQAAVERRAACMARAEHGQIEHDDIKEKEHKMRAEQDRKESASRPATFQPSSFIPTRGDMTPAHTAQCRESAHEWVACVEACHADESCSTDMCKDKREQYLRCEASEGPTAPAAKTRKLYTTEQERKESASKPATSTTTAAKQKEQCKYSSIADPHEDSPLIRHTFECPAGTIPAGAPNPKCSYKMELNTEPGAATHTVHCYRGEKPSVTDAELNEKESASKPAIIRPCLSEAQQHIACVKDCDKDGDVTKPESISTKCLSQCKPEGMKFQSCLTGLIKPATVKPASFTPAAKKYLWDAQISDVDDDDDSRIGQCLPQGKQFKACVDDCSGSAAIPSSECLQQCKPEQQRFESCMRPGAEKTSPAQVTPTQPIAKPQAADCTQHAQRVATCMEDCSSRNPTSSKDPVSKCEFQCRPEFQNRASCMSSPLSFEQRAQNAIDGASRDRLTVEKGTIWPLCQAECDRDFAAAARQPHDPRVSKSKHEACYARCDYDSLERMESDARQHVERLVPMSVPGVIAPVWRGQWAGEGELPKTTEIAHRSAVQGCAGDKEHKLETERKQCAAKPISRLATLEKAAQPTTPSPGIASFKTRLEATTHAVHAQQVQQAFQATSDGDTIKRKTQPVQQSTAAPAPQQLSQSARAASKASERSSAKPQPTRSMTQIDPKRSLGDYTYLIRQSPPRQGTGPLTQEELKKKAEEFVSDIRQINEQMRMALNAAIKSEETPAAPKQSPAPSYAWEPTGTGSFRPVPQSDKDAQFYKNLQHSIEVGTAIGDGIYLACDDKKTAHTVKGAVVGIGKMIAAYYSGNPALFISGAADLKSAFDEADESNQMMLQEIYESIKALSRQMAQNHAQVMKRFDRVDKMLEQEQRLIIQEFFKLHQETGDIKQAIRKLGAQAAQYHAQLQSNVSYNTHLMSSGQARIDDSLASLRIEEIHEIVEKAKEDADRKELSERDFVHHITELKSKAVTRAAEPHLTGGNVEVTDTSAIQTALKSKPKKLWKHPAFSNVNLLSKYAAHRCKTPHTDLVNPLIWTKCASLVVQMFQKKLVDRSYPSSKEQHMQDMERLQKLKKEGDKIIGCVKTLDKAGCIHEIAKDYVQKLQQLAALIKERQTAYETERTTELCEMHRKLVEAEAVAVGTAPIDCPECVKLTDTTWKTFKNKLGRAQFRGDSFRRHLKESIRFAHEKNEKLKKQLYDLEQLDDIINPRQHLKSKIKEHVRSIREKGPHTLSKIRLNTDDYLVYPPTYGRTIYPADPEQNKVTLLIDESQLVLEIRFIVAEQLGLGTIRYEYLVKNNTFNLYGYYCSNGSKILVAHKQLPYESTSLYGNDENVQHFWYGGRFPKEKDILSGSCHNDPGTWGHYPPENAYPAAHDTFKASARDMDIPSFHTSYESVTKQINDCFVNERIKFCKRIAAEAEPSTKSKVFKIIQELDVQFKLLDSYLTLMFNQLMYEPETDTLRPEFAVLHDSTVTYLKDEEAMSKYLDDYAQSSTGLAQQEFALQHIKQTQETIEKTFQGILGLKLQAGFAQVVNVLNGLQEVMAMYQRRVITPVKIDTESQELVLVMKQQLGQRDKEIAQRDKQIALLAGDKEVLTKAVTETRQEIGVMREQIRLVVEMLAKQTRA